MAHVPESEWCVSVPHDGTDPGGNARRGAFLTVLAKERPIGFYHTGPRLRSSDLEITELFKRFCPRPVMVIVDVRAKGGRGETGIPTDAYFAVEEIRDVSPALKPPSSLRFAD